MAFPCNETPCGAPRADDFTIQLMTLVFAALLVATLGFARFSVRRRRFELFQFAHHVCVCAVFDDFSVSLDSMLLFLFLQFVSSKVPHSVGRGSECASTREAKCATCACAPVLARRNPKHPRKK